MLNRYVKYNKINVQRIPSLGVHDDIITKSYYLMDWYPMPTTELIRLICINSRQSLK